MTHIQQPNEQGLNFQQDWGDNEPPDSWTDLLELLCDHGFAGMAQAMQTLLNEAMKLERSAVLGARPYERTHLRRGQANGLKPKTVQTRLGALELRVPQTRGVEFYPTALEKGQRSERALKLAVAEMYVQGVTTRKVTTVMQELCGLDVTSMQVSRAATMLDAELTAWRERPLGEILYLLLDARFEKVRVGGVVVTCALLVAIGITPDGRRTILGVSVALSEAEVHWRDFLAGHRGRPRVLEGNLCHVQTASMWPRLFTAEGRSLRRAATVGARRFNVAAVVHRGRLCEAAKADYRQEALQCGRGCSPRKARRPALYAGA